MDDNKALDDLLNARRIPQMRSNLEYRIIEEARRSSVTGAANHREAGKRRSLFASIWDGLLIPAPTVSLAVVLLIGAWGGLSFDVSQMAVEDIESMYFNASEMAEYGEFL